MISGTPALSYFSVMVKLASIAICTSYLMENNNLIFLWLCSTIIGRILILQLLLTDKNIPRLPCIAVLFQIFSFL